MTSLTLNPNKFRRVGSRLSYRFVFFRIGSKKTSNASTAFHSQTQFSLLRPSVPIQKSTGILTCFPSTTPVGLALGPDSPPTVEPCRGTLRFSGHWILTNVFVTQADILTSAPSTQTYVKASPGAERSPTDFFIKKSHSFGRFLSPGHCRRKNALPVSYYALFKK